jgi:hypothetical protein
MRKGNRQLLDLVFNNFAHLNYIKGITPKNIYENRKEYPEFWRDWCICFGKQAEYLESDLGRKYAIKKLAMIQKNARTRQCLKDFFQKYDLNKNAKLEVEKANQIIFEDTKQELITDGDKEVSVKTTKTITAKKIDRIEFNSPVTVAAFENIMSSQKLTNQWFNDYRKAVEASIQGKEYKGKFQFHQLELAGKYKVMVLELVDRCKNDIMTGSLDEVRLAEGRMKACNQMLMLLEGVMRVEMNPIQVMRTMHEAGINRQKEITTAAGNDALMVSTGSIVISDEKEVFNVAERRRKLKEQGFDRVNEIFFDQLRDAGAIDEEVEEIKEHIENPVIEDE